MLMMGLTGGIGAGKSTVTAVLAEEGAVVVDADRIAREVVEPGTPGLAMLVAEFGESILRPDGALDRPALAAVAFADPERTVALNAITHPLIGERTAELFASAPADGIVVHDMPLLVESGLAPTYHLVLVVDTPEQIRLDRLIHQRGMPEDDARARMSRQATDEQRHGVADVLVDNSGERNAVEACVRSLVESRLRPFEHNLRTAMPVYGTGEVVAHRSGWVGDGERAVARIRHALGGRTDRVEHVGPTSVPGLSAPDLIEIQVTVGAQEAVDAAVSALIGAGHVPATGTRSPVLHWCDPARPLEVTVRADEDPEQRFGLMISEVLADDPTARAEYQEIVHGADREAVQQWEHTRCARA